MQRNALFGGSQLAASESLFRSFVGPSTANRLIGSFASATRFACVQPCAPVCHASPSGTTWSICTAALVFTPRVKSIVVRV